MAAFIQDSTGCTLQEAEAALAKYGDPISAVDAMLPKTTVSGAKHIPPPRQIDTGVTPEQAELCATGRNLMDKLTAATSAAQTKIRSGQSLAGDAVQPVAQGQSQ